MTTPYAGNPSNYPATIPIPTGSDPPGSSLFATPYEGLADRTAYLNAKIVPFGGYNWREIVPSVTPVSGGGGSPTAGLNTVYWDFVNQVWIVPFIDGNYPTVAAGVPLVNSGFDERSDQWLQFGGSSGPVFTGFSATTQMPAMTQKAGDANTYLVAILDPGSVGPKIVSATPTSGTWTTMFNAPGNPEIESCNLIDFAGYNIAGFGSSSAASTMLAYSNDGFATDTLVIVGTPMGAPASEILMRVGATTGGGAFAIALPLTGPGFVTTFFYLSSTDGHTWIVQSGLNSVLSASEVCTGLDFGADSNGPCWILATQIPLTNTSKFYRSADGIVWTFISQTTTRAVRDLAVIGSLWAATTVDFNPALALYGAAGASYVIFSFDGAVTWHRSQAWLTANDVTTTRSQRAKLARSNAQFCLFNSKQLRFSDVSSPQTLFT